MFSPIISLVYAEFIPPVYAKEYFFLVHNSKGKRRIDLVLTHMVTLLWTIKKEVCQEQLEMS